MNKFKRLSILQTSALFALLIFMASAYPVPKAQKNKPLFVYTFGGLDKYSVEKQVNLLVKLGYAGLAVEVTKEADVARLEEYLKYTEKRNDFKIYSVFVQYNFKDTSFDRSRWKAVVDRIKNRNINLWIIFSSKTPGITDQTVDSILRNVNNYGELHHVKVTLYPHSYSYVATAEEALPFIKRINSPNLKLAVHLCHEIRAGNGARIAEVVKNVRGFIGYATLCGTDSIADLSDWYKMDTTTIKPLDRGNYDVRKFVKALTVNKFEGPIGFINFKIEEDPEKYLSRSIMTWRKLQYETSN